MEVAFTMFSSSFELMVRIARMLQVPERTAALDCRDGSEVIRRRRGKSAPFDGPGVTRIAARSFSLEVGPQKIGDENYRAQSLEEHTNRHDEIPDIPAAPGLIGVDSTRHAQHAGNVHEIERQVEPDEEQPEVELTQSLVAHLSRHLRKPVIESTEDREQNPAHDHVMKMCTHKV